MKLTIGMDLVLIDNKSICRYVIVMIKGHIRTRPRDSKLSKLQIIEILLRSNISQQCIISECILFKFSNIIRRLGL